MLSRADLPGYIERGARERGNALEPGVADLIAELAGPELGPVIDALERCCLYAGAGQAVTEDVVARMRGAAAREDSLGARGCSR